MVKKNRHLRNAQPPRIIVDTINRRNYLVASGVLGSSWLAGCLGDDDDAIDDADDRADDADVGDDADADADDSIDVADGDDADDGDEDDTGDTDEEVTVPEYHDVAFHRIGGGDPPADQQYAPYADAPGISGFSPWRGIFLVGMSVADYNHYGVVVDDWQYSPGVLEFTLHDDFYWWNGDQVTARDYTAQTEFQNYFWGGDDLNASEDIVTVQQIDDQTVRMTLADTWSEMWALHQTLEEDTLQATRTYYERWLDQFDDAPDLDAVQDIRDEISGDFATTDEDLVEFFMNPWEFRLDGSIGDVGEMHWEFEMVPEKNGNLRHLCNPEKRDHIVNYRRFIHEVVEEPDIRRQEAFLDGEVPAVRVENWSEIQAKHENAEFPFDTEINSFTPPPSTGAGWQFNHAAHPGDDPNFRRAWAYLTTTDGWEEHPGMFPVERNHAYFNEAELEAWVSEEVVDAFTDYDLNTMRFDDAEAELEAGGYERDADGNWLLQEDSPAGDAGEPMELSINRLPWMDFLHELGTDWYADIADFGLQNEVFADDLPNLGVGDWVVVWSHTGGGLPEFVNGNIFLDTDSHWFRNEYNIPNVVAAPPLLETTGPGASVDEWEEYEVVAMSERLPVTTEESAYQQIVDELAWVVNQAVNHMSVVVRANTTVFNNEEWTHARLDEHPEIWLNMLHRIVDYGVVRYVPEDER